MRGNLDQCVKQLHIGSSTELSRAYAKPGEGDFLQPEAPQGNTLYPKAGQLCIISRHGDPLDAKKAAAALAFSGGGITTGRHKLPFAVGLCTNLGKAMGLSAFADPHHQTCGFLVIRTLIEAALDADFN
jgi:hypothetical protein